jgi:hypothetical protein
MSELVEKVERQDALLKKRKQRESELKTRIENLKAERQHLRDQVKSLTARAEAAEAHALTSAGSASLWQRLKLAWSTRSHQFLSRWVWRYPMRLGVLHHHAPRPLDLKLAKPPQPKHWPTISLVTPSFNQAHFLLHTLQSVWQQDYPHLEYIVQDGGSTDGTVELLKQHSSQLTRWTSAPDAGLGDALAKAFATTSGEIMGWLNSDDLLLPGTLQRVAAYFAAHPEVDGVYGHRVLIDTAGQKIGHWTLPRNDPDMNRWVDFVPQETLFWRRRIYDQAGGIDGTFRFAVDWDLILRFQNAGAVVHRLPHFMGAFRVHDQQKSQAESHTIGSQECTRLRTRELGESHHPSVLQVKVVRFQAKAILCDLLLRCGIRW